LPVYHTPGVYIEEVSGGPHPIESVGTRTAAFLGITPDPDASVNVAVAINNWTEFVNKFIRAATQSTDLSHAVYGFFLNGGSRCYVVNVGKDGSIAGGGKKRTGIDLLEEVDEVAIVCAPGYTRAEDYETVLAHCEKLKDRFAILDAPLEVDDIDRLVKTATAPTAAQSKSKAQAAKDSTKDSGSTDGTPAGTAPPDGLRPRSSDGGYGAFYFPGITVRDPLSPKDLVDTYPSGFMAGVYARTDAETGVQTAPANRSLLGALNVKYRVTGEEQGELNQNGVNVIRFFPREGIRVWGARTLATSGEWKYLNVRRLFIMIEESIAISLRWSVFQLNDESLWKDITRDVKAFLTLLWRDGALVGKTPQEAFFVKCDAETNPPEVVDAGMVVCVIGLAPAKPAEFIVFRIGQHAGGTEVETL
jgi:phage tail sheath protein FI